MTKEQLKKKVKYQDKVLELLNSPVPEKQVHRSSSYKAYLQKELRDVTRLIEEAKMEGVK